MSNGLLVSSPVEAIIRLDLMFAAISSTASYSNDFTYRAGWDQDDISLRHVWDSPAKGSPHLQVEFLPGIHACLNAILILPSSLQLHMKGPLKSSSPLAFRILSGSTWRGQNVEPPTLTFLSKKLWELDIPFLVCRSYGFVGYLRIQFIEHTVIETHPDNQISDLRLDVPFSELKNHIDAINLSSLEYKDHAHVPYLIILYKYLQQWRQQNEGRLPKTYKEKESLRTLIRTDVFLTTLNYKHILIQSKSFWIMAKAMRDFVDNEGKGFLPLRGSIPDMTAETSRYIALQQVYHNQASKDAEAVFRRAQQLLHQLNQPSDIITETDIKLFCKHATDLHVVRGTSVADEYDFKTPNMQNIAAMLENPESTMIYYVMLRGVDRFYSEYNTYPGEFDDQVEPDIVKLKACVSKLLSEWGCGPLAKDDYVHEVCRCGAAELHSVAAFIGGCAAQEIIKFITRQYKPLNNTLIYDAITSNTATFVF
ncbi:unnamed protein product [Timema podura]|uniref:NEDD8-activating enzyme E1 regulatory subunit n=1 Tax=Timema podura TaxID=61482 RepID=A0ABN7NWR3_TIMPD|nr:unnamed protein product [Timema podura]